MYFFIIFYDAYLEILRFKIYFKNCVKYKGEEKRKKGGSILY